MAEKMPDREFVEIGLRVTRVMVGALSLGAELDRFIDACCEQVDTHDDEPARFALASAEAVRTLRDGIRELTAGQIAAVVTIGSAP